MMLRWAFFFAAALALVVWAPQRAGSESEADPNVGRLFFHEGITIEQLWDAATKTWYVPVRSKRLGELEEETEEVEDWEDAGERDEEVQTFLIAVVDSGALLKHPALKGRVADQRDFTGEGIEDAVGHGAYVALTLAQASPPEMQLLIAKVAGADGTVSKSAFIEGLRWAADRGATIAYAYLGFEGDPLTHHDLCEAIEELHELTIFAAAGTLGRDADVFPAHCGSHGIIPIGCAGPDGKPLPSSGRAAIYGRCDVQLEPFTED